ncbi:helix-turn-helix transcriptional regulator [Pseudarthrobacter sulfonivorans]|uniref:helix-turn-helix domain-containing protein n=1 Tax=Pseudarthrobacter sulfonivorans TaxID=121292 RepID=UPI00285EE269|nr:helix-turn-helix transcriptional regulator [Pseudarthrobacter sulfonivorans]MDR6413477.1 transcriptional regulator with XRE-family HTH domain [Pseudarthrobacter sulfonivorans]
MTQDHMQVLGQVVRELRIAKKLTQDELGTKAGYRSGAGVSISRLENGQLRPGAERLDGVAEALGLTREELETRVSRQTVENVEAATADATATESRSPEGSKDRYRRIEQEIDARKRDITDLSRVFNEARDRALDDFFGKFTEIAGRIEGARQPDPTQLHGKDPIDVIDSKVQVATDGVPQPPASSTSGAATDFQLVWLKRAAQLAAAGAGGAMVLPILAAAPLAAFGIVEIAKRNRKRQQEFDAKLKRAEAELDATTPGFKALQNILPRATETLDYIAVHAGHALNRWENQIRSQVGSGPVTWELLSHGDRQLYNDFFEIAAAQITVLTIDVQSLLTTLDGDGLNQLITQADEALTQSQNAVQTLV